MAFTDHCDLYAAVNEAGLNLIARHIMRQRPSLFNYATSFIAQHPSLACEPVDASADIITYNNPLFATEDPLPLLGIDAPPVALNYCAQLTKAEVDFFPGNVIALPAELNPPLPAQHFSMAVRICAGLDCAWDELGKIEPWPPSQQPGAAAGRDRPPPAQTPPEVPSGRKLDCFCLDGLVIGHAAIQQLFGQPTLVAHVDAVDVVELAPPGLKQAVNCYIRDTIELLLREKLMFPLVHTFFFDFAFLKLPGITVQPAPNPPILHNPAIEDDQIKVFVDFKVVQ
jgi:hypothetical protein